MCISDFVDLSIIYNRESIPWSIHSSASWQLIIPMTVEYFYPWEPVVQFLNMLLFHLWNKNIQKSKNHFAEILTHLKKFFYYYYFFLLYNIVLVLPYINMHLPRVYTCSPSWTPLPLPSPYHPSGSSQCTSPKLPVSCIEPGLAIHFLYGLYGRGRGGMIWENGIKTCIIWYWHILIGFPCGPNGKESACNAGDLSSMPGLGLSQG